MDLSNEQQQQQHHHLHHQEMGSDETLESMLECRKSQQQQQQEDQKKAGIRPAAGEESLKCPRCDSTNTKFCYYNNYSLTQPRYFCKSCRRYWTKGGTLRNVPVGGGCRKNNKRSSSSSNNNSSSSSFNSSSKRAQDNHSQSQSLISSPNHHHPLLSSLITGLSSYDQNEYSDQISLAIARLQNQNQIHNHHFGQMGFEQNGYSVFGDDAMRGVGYFENPSLINGFHNHNQLLIGGGTTAAENGGGFLRNLGLINNGSDDNQEMLGMINSGNDQDMLGGNCGNNIGTSVKQEVDQNRLLMAGFPWQFAAGGGGGGAGGGGDQTGNMVDYEPPVKPNWNGFGSSSWHGLLNSPLM